MFRWFRSVFYYLLPRDMRHMLKMVAFSLIEALLATVSVHKPDACEAFRL